MGSILVDKESCKGCGLCVAFCNKDVIRISQGLNQAGHHPAEVVSDDCSACARCALMCPDVAITVQR